MSETICTIDDLLNNTPDCSFGYDLSVALDKIQRVFYVHDKKVDIRREGNKIIIEFMEE